MVLAPSVGQCLGFTRLTSRTGKCPTSLKFFHQTSYLISELLGRDGYSRWCPYGGTESAPKMALIVPAGGAMGIASVPIYGAISFFTVPASGLRLVFLITGKSCRYAPRRKPSQAPKS